MNVLSKYFVWLFWTGAPSSVAYDNACWLLFSLPHLWIKCKLFTGCNSVEVASAFADLRVYDCVREKFDSLPPPDDNKKMRRKKPSAKSSQTRPTTSAAKLETTQEIEQVNHASPY